VNGSSMNTSHVILKGFPPDDSIAVSQMVTLHHNESNYDLSDHWKGQITDAKVVGVRLILWWV
jgi:hypothetical protein